MSGMTNGDRDGAERDIEALLDGVGDGPLHRLLSAARAPGTAVELSGEEAALRAFRLGVTPPQLTDDLGRPGRARVLRRLIAVNVAVAAALVVSGVALAAGGVIPLPFTESPQVVDSSSQPGPPGTTGPATSTDRRVGPGSIAPTLGAPPAAAIPGLCHAYLSHVAAHRGERWPDPAGAALILAAGGEDQMETFCTGVIGAEDAEKDKSKEKEKDKEKPDKPGDPGHAGEKTKPARADESVPVSPRTVMPKPS